MGGGIAGAGLAAAVSEAGPAAPLVSWPAHLLDTAPLYAGESVARISDIRSAGELVRLLAG